jgi:hypothetical protein
MKRGYYTPQEKRQTRIWALPALLEAHPELPQDVTVRPPPEPIELRARNSNRLIDYTDTPRTNEWRRVLEQANRVNENAQVEYFDVDEGATATCTTWMKAIFIGDFDHYGRLHSYGYRHPQGLSKTQRRSITINKQSVVELDYSGLQPRMLYAAEGIQYDGDPYAQVIDAIPGLRERSLPKRSRGYLRGYCKRLLLALLNAESITKAEQAGNQALHEHPEEYQTLRQMDAARARPWIEAFQHVHAPIAHYFGTAAGLKLMNRDARIALDVVAHFAYKGLPTIPIHDSFIVQEPYADELRQVMDVAYRRHNDGFAPIIKPPAKRRARTGKSG